MRTVHRFLIMILVITIVAPCLPVFANGRFSHIGDSSTASFYMDIDSIKFARDKINNSADKSIIMVWVKIIHNQDGVKQVIESRKKSSLSVKNYDKLDHSQTLFMVNKKNKEITSIKNCDYDSKGNALWESEFPIRWQTAAPESMAETIIASAIINAIIYEDYVMSRS